ncbi:MAG TPA: cytidine deaminase [Stellaceae bacterium]|nr:cytidine deaminase [Stellaceae bacterium]
MAVDDSALLQAAEAALRQAYARYSRFRVGAALLTAGGRVYRGCNVESISFPVGQCAERNAIAAAVLEEGPAMRIARLLVTAEYRGQVAACTPCGACRQAIVEFGADATVLFRDAGGALLVRSAAELLPSSFGFGDKG